MTKQTISLWFLTSLLASVCCNDANKTNYRFPDDFIFGISSAAYQIEGGWNAGGKGLNIWDNLTHEQPERICGRGNGDISSDAYHHAVKDIELLKDLGVKMYRFSISWSRMLPSGLTDKVNPDGVRYYNELIDGLIKNGIQPMVTLYHWDLPQALQNIDGWLNPKLADYFADYARVMFETFGDRVKYWLTFNEPKGICEFGYGGTSNAPAMNMTGIGGYLCAHTLIRAHAKAYHMYHDRFASQNGKISISVDTDWFEPKNWNNPSDVQAADRKMMFNFGWFTNPIFSKEGDYPKIMKDRVARISKQQHFPKSRLPEFTPEEIKSIRGTYDYMGLNVYTSNMVDSAGPDGDAMVTDQPNYWADIGVYTWFDPSWPSTGADWLKVVPWGCRKLLKWIKDHYENVDIIITENGYPQNGIEDWDRISFFNKYLTAVLEAIHEDGVNVKGYCAWSFLDSFEWYGGYCSKFGLFQVDFNDPNRKRTPRYSAMNYKQIIKSKVINPEWKPQN